MVNTFVSFFESALTYGHKKSADLPFSVRNAGQSYENIYYHARKKGKSVD